MENQTQSRMFNEALVSVVGLLVDVLKTSQAVTALGKDAGPAYENAKKAYDKAFSEGQKLVFLWANTHSEFRDALEAETGWKVPSLFDLIDPLTFAKNVERVSKRFGI